MKFRVKLIKPEAPRDLADLDNHLQYHYAEAAVEAKSYISAARVHVICTVGSVALMHPEVVVVVRNAYTNKRRYFRVQINLAACEVKI